MKWIIENWERLLFRLIGVVVFGFGFSFLVDKNVTGAAATFAISFFCFFYANISRFKRFKGLGFEAELWEEKQKEAGELVEKLKNIISIYSREVLLSKVKEGRWDAMNRWEEIWSLYDEIKGRHGELGLKIDFSDIKKTLVQYFLFDIIMTFYEPLRIKLMKAQSQAQKVIEEEFGSPIKDAQAYGLRVKELHEIPTRFDEPFQLAEQSEFAAKTIDLAQNAKRNFKERFGVEVDFNPAILEKLESLVKIENQDFLQATPELISMAGKN